ncbi:MAG: ABC transporter substrate-binding protein [Chloroflexi bacterium]|nr:ABC transporter substrate-binding protein [Chloroflexota bacterium]
MPTETHRTYDIMEEGKTRVGTREMGETTGAIVQEMKKQVAEIVAQDVPQTAPQVLNLNVRAKPWDDVRVGRAVSLAIDREAVAKVVRGGFNPAYSYVLPRTPWVLPDEEVKTMPAFRQPKDQDIAEAKRLLAETGFPDGFKTTLMTASSVSVKESAEAVQNQLAKIGIGGTIQVIEASPHKERLFKGEFGAAVHSDSSAHPDPDVVLGAPYVTGSSQNYGGWSNKKFDELYDVQSSTLDAAKRIETVREMQRVIHQEAPKVILSWAKRWAVWWPQAKNWKSGTGPWYNHKMDLVWLDR